MFASQTPPSSRESSRSFWTMPWSYAQAVTLSVGWMGIGLALEVVARGREVLAPEWPWNAVVLVLLAGLAVGIGTVASRYAWAAWLGSLPVAVVSLAYVMVLALIATLVPQTPEMPLRGLHLLGLNHIFHSWMFVLGMLWLMLSLGVTTVRRLRTFRWHDWGFYANHLGLWVALASAFFGSGDVLHVKIKAPLGRPVVYGSTTEGQVRELPFAVVLKKFTMETYPPSLTLFRSGSTTELLKKREVPMRVVAGAHGHLRQWEISILDVKAHAVRMGDEVRPVYMPGAVPAVRVEVRRQGEATSRTGWVFGGNARVAGAPMSLEGCDLGLQPAKPRSFQSDLELLTPDGQRRTSRVEVNHPVRIRGWWLYQFGYDETMGEFSDYSVFEAVYDPWLPGVYAGIALLALGAISLGLALRSPVRGGKA